MSKEFTTDQMSRLREIEKARVRQGQEGLRAEIQELIDRLSRGPSRLDLKLGMLRKEQAQKLWDHGWDKDTYESFEQYLATIPQIPQELLPDEHFKYLVLVDRRTPLKRAAQYLNVKLNGGGDNYVNVDPHGLRSEQVYWMKCQDGTNANYSKTVRECREKVLKPNETGLTLFEGLSWFAQNFKDAHWFATMDTSLKGHGDKPYDENAVTQVRCYSKRGEVYRIPIDYNTPLCTHCPTRYRAVA